MASLLYRLGRSAFRHRRPVTIAWVAFVAAMAVGALTLAQPTVTTLTVPGTESQQALGVLEEKFPALDANGASARVVVQAPAGQTLKTPTNKAAVESLVAKLKGAPQIAAVLDPFQAGAVNPTGTTAYIQVSYVVPASNLSGDARTALTDIVATGRDAGLTAEVGGTAMHTIAIGDIGEVIGVLAAAVVLVLILGSLVAAGLPLVGALFGIAIGLSGIGIATHFVELASVTSTLALMLGLAVAIDYSLFIVSRYRHELATGLDPEDAAGRAIATAGSAVVFAGSTVVIALAALSVVGIPLLTQMGLGAAFTVAASVLIAITLLPALLGFAGRRLHPASGAGDPEANAASGFGARWARFITTRPVPVVVVAVIGLLVLATPVLDLRLGLPDDSSSPVSSTQHKAYDLLAENFGPGINGPLLVVLDASKAGDPRAAATAATAAIGKLPDVVAVTPAMFDQAGTTAILQVIPASGPESAATEALVGAIRAASPGLASSTGATMAVTGQTALNIDTTARMRDALAPYLLVVVGLALLLLAIVFRSILVPIKAAAGFILSVGATFGILVAVFQWGWLGSVLGVAQTGPVISVLPIMLIGIVFGLGMDYEVFLVTRMREEHALGAEPRAAVVTGFAHGGRVVGAAAIIMIAVFGGFVLTPDPTIKSIAFALAAAVFLDAFVVRMTIVPAVMAIAGKAAWWLPGWLDRLLPTMDVEGVGIRPSVAVDAGTVAGQLVPEPVAAERTDRR
jgi:RND superfamily putative drug exporter